jgi:hypothetical protein
VILLVSLLFKLVVPVPASMANFLAGICIQEAVPQHTIARVSFRILAAMTAIHTGAKQA